MSQAAPKIRNRDKFLNFLGVRPRERSVSPIPPTNPNSDRSDPSQPEGEHAQSTPSSKRLQQKTFKRGSSLEKDLAVLSTTYLLQDNAKLRELIVLIIRLRDRDEDDKVSVTVSTTNIGFPLVIV